MLDNPIALQIGADTAVVLHGTFLTYYCGENVSRHYKLTEENSDLVQCAKSINPNGQMDLSEEGKITFTKFLGDLCCFFQIQEAKEKEIRDSFGAVQVGAKGTLNWHTEGTSSEAEVVEIHPLSDDPQFEVHSEYERVTVYLRLPCDEHAAYADITGEFSFVLHQEIPVA